MKFTIISRDEFLKLIKFGNIYQTINYIVDEKNQQKIISEILKSLPYDDPFGYVVVKLTYEESFSISHMQTLVKLDIKDIINIYCLTNEALDFYQTKFNPNIKFKLFENQELIKEIDSYKLIEDKKKGIQALFDIFKLNLKDINEKFNAEYISELLNYKEKNYLEQDYKNFYFDLFCYERKNSFFKEDIGFIADIRAISKMQDIRKNKEKFLSGNYSNLSNEKDREKIDLTLKILIIDSIEKVKTSDKKTDEEKNETIRNLVIGAIFFKSQQLLNTESREQNYWESFINFVNEFKEKFLEETKEALWYLGVFLGYKYLYNDYYNFLDLNIFKENELNNLSTNEEESEELSKKETQLESHIKNNVSNNNLDIESTQDILVGLEQKRKETDEEKTNDTESEVQNFQDNRIEETEIDVVNVSINQNRIAIEVPKKESAENNECVQITSESTSDKLDIHNVPNNEKSEFPNQIKPDTQINNTTNDDVQKTSKTSKTKRTDQKKNKSNNTLPFEGNE